MLIPRTLAIHWLLAASVLTAASPTETEHSMFPEIRVQDTDGNPLPGTQAAVRKDQHISNFLDGWYQADKDGLIRINIDRAKGHWESAIAEGNYRVLLRLKGYAPATLLVEMPSTHTELAAVMHPGQAVKFQVKPYTGTQLPPDLIPVVVDSRVATSTLRSFFHGSEYNHLGEPLHLFDVEKTGDTSFKTRVPEGLDFPLLVVINHPDYMQNYVSREFSPAELLQGIVFVELPVPGQLKVQLQPEENTATDTFEITELTAAFWKEDALPVITTGSNIINAELKNVIPGEYQVSFRGLMATTGEDSRQFPSYAKAELSVYPEPTTVTAGSHTLVEFNYPVLPKNYFDGDGSATITFKSASGRSVAGLPYRVLGHTESYQHVPVRRGTLPDDGVIHVKDLRRDDIRYYDLQLGTVSSSIFTFKDDSHVSATRYIAPAEGDIAPQLEAWDVETSEKLSLTDLKGKIILMEFWATWCGPCQPSMQKLTDIAKALPADLQDDVELITISVDESPGEVKERLKKKGWANSKVRHYWYGPGTPSARGGPYGVTSIPHAVIIGKDGTIAVPDFHINDDLVDTLKRLQK